MLNSELVAAEIIVVDDDPIAGTLTTEILADAGYRMLLISESVKAMAAIKANRPRLCVLDILMPGIDGITLCKMIKEDPETRGTRIIIVSGKSFQAEKDRALRLGADQFVEKPYNVDTFAQGVTNLIGAPAGGPAEPEPAPPPEAPAATLKLKFWGTRSAPLSAPSRYGTRTPCVTVESGRDFYILDAGTGLLTLGQELVAKRNHLELWLLLTHFHPNHTDGILDFPPLFDPEFTIHWAGANDLEMAIETFLTQSLQAAYQKTGKAPSAQMDFYEFIESSYNLNAETKLGTVYMNHPTTSLCYLIERGGKKVVYCPDSELYSDPAALQDFNEKFAGFAQGANLLVHDALYTEDDYERNKNQGHSSFASAVDEAARSGVKDLVLFHHNALYPDAVLDGVAASAAQKAKEKEADLKVQMATEGLTLEV